MPTKTLIGKLNGSIKIHLVYLVQYANPYSLIVNTDGAFQDHFYLKFGVVQTKK